MEICADVGQSEGPGPATSAELRLRVRETGAWAVRAGGGHGPPRSLQCVWSCSSGPCANTGFVTG